MKHSLNTGKDGQRLRRRRHASDVLDQDGAATFASDRESAIESARKVGLRYVSDASAGLQRERVGTRFRYRDADGRVVRNRETLARIKALVIPPAWNEVWICALANGHIQVTARDAKGRKQYRYHALWRSVRDENKYEHLISFGNALPTIRLRVEKDLALPGLPREKVLATIVRLLETTMMRVGNEEYARTNGSFGLTTLRDKHVRIDGTRLEFQFRGKSGVKHNIKLADRRLAGIRCFGGHQTRIATLRHIGASTHAHSGFHGQLRADAGSTGGTVGGMWRANDRRGGNRAGRQRCQRSRA